MQRSLLLAVLVVLAAPVAALLPAAGRSLSATRPAAVSVRMGPAEDGPFTPLCLAGKVVLGQTTFNKYRGKIISIHSGVIGDFCEEFGVPRQMKAALIKKAKFTGGKLGMLS